MYSHELDAINIFKCYMAVPTAYEEFTETI